MRRLTGVAVGLISMLGVTHVAFAADLAPRTYTKAAPVAAPIYNWGGFYVGLNGGGGWSHNCWNVTNSLGTPVPAAPSEGCNNASGAVAGGQVGYRWQLSNWVLGLEAQGDWANLKGSHTSAIGTFFGSPFSDETKVDAIGLFTGQVGYAWSNVLWYVKGGAAVTHNTYSGVSQVAAGGFPVGYTFDKATATRWGAAVGTGVEFGFAPGWSVALEYDHVFLGRSSYDLYNTLGPFDRTERVRQAVDLATVRVNYTFGAPVVAKY